METREQLSATSLDAAQVAWEHATEASTGPDAYLAREIAKTIAASMNGVRCAILATLAEPAQPMITAEPPWAWGSFELLGHRQHIGLAQEGEFAGKRGFWLRTLDRTTADTAHVGEKEPPLKLNDSRVFYSNAALFSFTPIDGADAAADEWRVRNHYSRGDIPF